MIEPHQGEPPLRPQEGFWRTLLSVYPFLFIPIVIAVGVVAAFVMPYLTGVQDF